MSEKNILIVEDEKIVALDIQKQLQRNGYAVGGMYGSGEEALSAINDERPDLVLMDIQLQGELDGVETAGIIKDNHSIPVILLTAYADEQTIERAKFIEPFGYITKPFEERSLCTTIEMAIYKSSMDKLLHESEEKYRKFFEDDLSGDFIAGPDGKIEDCNPAFMNMLGFPNKETALQTNLNSLLLEPEIKNLFWKELTEVHTIKLKEFKLNTFDNKWITVLANVNGTFHDGELIEVKGYLSDVTQKRELEEQLRHAQKMEAVGRLTGGIAHDFNNILTVMLGYSSVMKDKIDDHEDVISEIESLRAAVYRAIKLTKQLLVFSRKEVFNPQVIDLNDLTKNLTKMLGRIISEKVTLKFFLDADTPYVFIDPGQLEQILINLVVNAKDAMQDGGQILVQTKNVYIETEESSVNGVIPQGNYIRLSIKDNGSGISEENLSKIFEPFFTTKPQGEGTGLGLSIVYGIINQNNAYLKVHSDKDKGTEFVLFFQQREQMTAADSKHIDVEDYISTGETILLVDDDENVRDITGNILRRKGFNVIEAVNGGEAILLCERNKESIDLLLADYIMPLIGGDLLAERLLTIIPTLKIVLMTGDPEISGKNKFIQGNNITILKKPFEIADLVSVIKETLNN